ncbi:MAG: coproporphyrinogen III oxidase [Melioribacteraceae bacterium]|nr:MAG: coproporphyrinogen III oxidase [Melioribacteraceae bacterium]
MKDLSVYIHIPFCDHKCIYCDFYSIINYKGVDSYLVAIKNEIRLQGKKYSGGRCVKSVFFGGGTPSFMTPSYIGEILNEVKNEFEFAADCEVTMETNPGTVDKSKLVDFRNVGINRISIGIQSFNKDELEFLTRIHNAETAINTVNAAHESGFEDISIDLIFNLPGQTSDKWLSNLEKAVSLPVTHISAYSLILEKGTILNKMVLDGKVELQDSDFDAELYSATIDYLRKSGFLQYEVSNFAKEGFQCYHNKIYWEYGDYLGFGTSAHSFMDGKRFWNYSALSIYEEAIRSKQSAIAGSELLTKNQKREEFVMLALRSSGLNKNKLTDFFNKNDFEYIVDRINKKGYSNFFNISTDILALNEKGYAVGDEIITELLL